MQQAGREYGQKMSTTDSSTFSYTIPTNENAPAAEASTNVSESSLAAGGIPGQWEDVEKQRDVAFKIVYFFIAFIALTFGLLYAYYKVDKKE
jgi:hypothetical protein